MAGHSLETAVFHWLPEGWGSGVDSEGNHSSLLRMQKVILDGGGGMGGLEMVSFGILGAFFHRVSLLCRFFNWRWRWRCCFNSAG
ncbi:hypothetical protein CEXT_426991 [Caerostris extrusa]|uniref:Uncharacterized protein n=1 Tax=Caerostris extrusa TaxID=172846 RepID=A0AAV4SE08_CAEEX|nr:hypothetical protein CEXT_426991 [Caerostris extrusa]